LPPQNHWKQPPLPFIHDSKIHGNRRPNKRFELKDVVLGYKIMLNSTIRSNYRFSSAWVDGWMDDGWMGLEQINFPHLPGRLTLFSTGWNIVKKVWENEHPDFSQIFNVEKNHDVVNFYFFPVVVHKIATIRLLYHFSSSLWLKPNRPEWYYGLFVVAPLV
jgi:hypothetical protein